jgi:3-deoxy-D-manno-octulosonic acid kinase
VKPAQKQQNQDYFLFDQDVLDHVSLDHFNPAYYQQRHALRGQAARGRGAAHFITLTGNLDGVLRHYRRGGWMARLTEDRYVWSGLDRTRAWREWRLLRVMIEKQLPVPQPVAAHVRHHSWYYTADIITRQIATAESLAVLLEKEEIRDELWRRLGNTIRRFHQQGIYHADLNAHNILMDDKERFYLIDFDKGEQCAPAPAWQRANIERLHRSLQKLTQQNPSEFRFRPLHWDVLLQAYSSGN